MVRFMDDRAEKRHISKLKAAEAQRKLRIDDFIRQSMETARGREFMYWLLSLCRMGQNPFTSNALTTSFACGELNVGQQVQAQIIENSPANFLKMLAEKEEERLNASRLDTTNDSTSGDDSTT
jgi:hypothetical protein